MGGLSYGYTGKISYEDADGNVEVLYEGEVSWDWDNDDDTQIRISVTVPRPERF